MIHHKRIQITPIIYQVKTSDEERKKIHEFFSGKRKCKLTCCMDYELFTRTWTCIDVCSATMLYVRLPKYLYKKKNERFCRIFWEPWTGQFCRIFIFFAAPFTIWWKIEATKSWNVINISFRLVYVCWRTCGLGNNLN